MGIVFILQYFELLSVYSVCTDCVPILPEVYENGEDENPLLNLGEY